MKLVLPTKPLSIIDVINRRALATGHWRNAMVGSDADYNGHNVSVWWNDYRKYWIAHYTWSGPHVIARGTLESCLVQAKAFYGRQGRGASVEVNARNDEEVAIAMAAGYIPADLEDRSWQDWKHGEVNNALYYERQGFGAYTHHLVAATSREDYEARCKAGHRESPIAAMIGGAK